jgi:hypothetical protein
MLPPAVIEDRARQAIENAKSGAKSENSLIELKRQLPEPRKAARQVAALCNAAPEDGATWVVGVDEDGTFSSPTDELANWLPQVDKCFDGTHPTCTVLNIRIEDHPLVLLHFHAVLRPFVVIRESGDREVPWRAGNKTRSATRSELLSLLVPTIARPDWEIVKAEIAFDRESNGLTIRMEIYMIPTSNVRLAMPLHKCQISVESSGQSFSFPPATISWFAPPGTPLSSPLQLVFEKPDFFGLVATHQFSELHKLPLSKDASILFSAGFAGSETTIEMRAMPPQTILNDSVQRFSLEHPRWFVR